MVKRFLVLLIAAIPFRLVAQETWDLRKCVDYAMQNNISVKQADIQSRLAALQAKQIQSLTIPTLNFNTQGGLQFGRNIDPTTNQYTTTRVGFQSYSLQTGITLFNWFNIKNNISSNNVEAEAVKLDVSRMQNDIGLNVAAAYLQLLLSIEQIDIAKTQIQLTASQLDLTLKQVNAGSMPELNAAQLQSQLATDSSSYITAVSTMQLNKLQLLALLDLDAATPLEVSLPDINKIPLTPLSDLDPAALYQIALNTQPQQQVNALKIKSAEYGVKSAKGAMYPTLSMFAGINTNYGSTYQEFLGVQPTGKFDTLAVVPVGATNYYAIAPGFTSVTKKSSYFRQIGDLNLSQNIGLQLTIPIFNNRQLRTNYERAKINVENLRLTQDLANQTLQQNIYTAYNNALTAVENYNANSKAADYAQYAFDLSKKRYDIGMLSTVDYITTQNNLNKAKINLASAHYEYIFRLKVLEYYKLGIIRL